MGNCIGGEPTQDDTTNRIDAESRKKKLETDKVLKMLWLGPGESGKSTLFRRIKTLYGESYTDDERQGYRVPICNNVVTGMKILVRYAQNDLTDDLKEDFDDKTAEAAAILEEIPDGDQFDSSRALVIKTLWKHPAIKNAFTFRAKCHVPDSTEYFFDKVEVLGDFRYLPTEEDCLRSRIRTLGIIETQFEVFGLRVRMLDVGGQKSERRKWIRCFDDVSAVLFVVALSEYDQQMFEDESVNRMTDSLALFSEIVNTQMFSKSTTILFLNKKDLFREKVQKVPLKVCFPSYDGAQNYEEGVKFIEGEFQKIADLTQKKIYVHLTCGLDQSDVESAFATSLDVIRKSHAPKTSDAMA